MDSSHAGPILIAEDDRNIASLVRTYLEQAGFSVLVAHDGRAALALARSRRPIFVILDWMLPGMDGTEICRERRKTSDVPILMLTARGDETDRVVGFAVGADDYVVKPFSPRELVERVKAILRRAGWRDAEPSRALGLGRLLVEPEKHKVTLDGRPVQLTPSEYKLLLALASHPGRVFSRDELLSRLNPDGDVVDRVIDVHIGKLRQKIEADPSHPAFILTVHGIGYRFAEAED
jgi:DNA-binding response OmpR family regulator